MYGRAMCGQWMGNVWEIINVFVSLLAQTTLKKANTHKIALIAQAQQIRNFHL